MERCPDCGEEEVVKFWKKSDPFLTDIEGFQKFVERVQKFRELYAEVTTWKELGVVDEKRKYRRIDAVFGHEAPKQPRRFCGLFYMPINNFLTFEEAKRRIEKHGDRFICFDIMHEELLDHDPERPHVKGCFSKHSYYNYDWEPIEKPEIIKKIERHLRRVSNWYSSGAPLKGESCPTPPLWIDES